MNRNSAGPKLQIVRFAIALVAAAAVYLVWSVLSGNPLMFIPGMFFILIITPVSFTCRELFMMNSNKGADCHVSVWKRSLAGVSIGALSGFVADVAARIIAVDSAAINNTANLKYWSIATDSHVYILAFSIGGMLAGAVLGAGVNQLSSNQRSRALTLHGLSVLPTALYLAALFSTDKLCRTPSYVASEKCDQIFQHVMVEGFILLVMLQVFIGWIFLQRKVFPGQTMENAATIIAAVFLFVAFAAFTWITMFVLFANIY